ncbi:MAG: histidine kinase [Bacteroidota bacterium]|nr:histidine kinase [Bacteroidota bacterium]
MKERFDKINDLLTNYSLGNFDYSVAVSDALDEIDSIILGINMLGEELKATTISKNYFNDIFNSVTDMVFVLSNSRSVDIVNQKAFELLQYYSKEEIINKVEIFITEDSNEFSYNIISFIDYIEKLKETEAEFLSKEGKRIPTLCTIGQLKNIKNENIGLLLVAKDISKQKEAENLIIRTIVNTQEIERTRVAKDLHDSLGQQLSAIKFYLGTLQISENKQVNAELIQKSNEALLGAIQELRDICFNIMPNTLQTSNLNDAISELALKFRVKDQLEIIFKPITPFPYIDKSIEIAIYRIIQEFINNSIKHGKASIIQIELKANDNELQIYLNDNGIGFDIHDFPFRGMGLKNIESRVKSFGGKIKMDSKKNVGTTYFIIIPF